MTRDQWCRRLALVATFSFIGTAAGATDGPVDSAKALYAAASFEDALAALDQLDPAASRRTDALQYKALCLLALGRSAEAQAVTDVLVSTAPTFMPSDDDDVSPRFIELLNDTRRRMLPDIAKRVFSEGRDAFRARQLPAAKRLFEQVMVLAGDDVWNESVESADLRTLASGFLDLLTVNGPPVPTANADAPPRPPAPVAVTLPRQPDVVSSSGKSVLLPPMAIEQPMPKWRPRDAATARRQFTGAVRIRIGVDGSVMNAAIELATDPDYDKLLLEAARSWRYKPATRNGEPIEVEKLVTFSLKTF